MNRDLDGYYFVVDRGIKHTVSCFSDMSLQEMQNCCDRMNRDELEKLAIGLGKQLRELGDEFNITRMD